MTTYTPDPAHTITDESSLRDLFPAKHDLAAKICRRWSKSRWKMPQATKAIPT